MSDTTIRNGSDTSVIGKPTSGYPLLYQKHLVEEREQYFRLQIEKAKADGIGKSRCRFTLHGDLLRTTSMRPCSCDGAATRKGG